MFFMCLLGKTEDKKKYFKIASKKSSRTSEIRTKIFRHISAGMIVMPAGKFKTGEKECNYLLQEVNRRKC